MTGVYDDRLVALSFAVAVLASYTAIDLVGRVSAAAGRSRRIWFMAAAAAMGTGIWSMHFLGMLAFHLPVPIHYSVPLWLLSIAIAMVASVLAVSTMTGDTVTIPRLMAAAPRVGIAIAAMHYVGMASIRIPGTMSYDPVLVAVSVAIAVASSGVALLLMLRYASMTGLRGVAGKLGGALVMGLAICGMHYTGMAAASFHAPSAHAPGNLGPGLLIASRVLATTVAAGTLAVLGLAVAGAAIERRVRGTLAERVRLQEEVHVRRSEARFRALVQRSSDVILILDASSRIRYSSPAIERIFGYPADSAAGTHLLDLLHPDDAPAARAYFEEAAASSGDLRPAVWRLRHSDGGWRHVDCAGANLTDDQWVGGIVLNVRDISERVKLEAELTHQAFHDSLTGLANRVLFRDRVEHALKREGRVDTGVAVLFLDLDDFKTVNDSLGHDAGDGLLCSVAARLLNATRGCDTVARLGGDEFGVSLENVQGPEDAIVVAQRILKAMKPPFHVAGREVRMSVSLGVVLAREGEGIEALLRHADLAMYSAKQAGKNRFELFAPEMHSRIVERLRLEADLRSAVSRLGEDDEEFYLVYQPIVELATGSITSAEALVRWEHPERGMVSPADFIPLAEEMGVIDALGRWIVRQACREAARWESAPGRAAASISINISGRQLSNRALIGEVEEVLRATGLAADRVIFEITETAMMSDTEEALRSLGTIRAMGIRVAVDDFGTGYSSLSYLQKFPVDILKIDKSFVEAVSGGGQASALTRTIVALADTLALRTVAEGIETVEQAEHLAVLGCDSGQGYLFAAPLRAEEARALLLSGEAAALV